jgi:hypothetical protein
MKIRHPVFALFLLAASPCVVPAADAPKPESTTPAARRDALADAKKMYDEARFAEAAAALQAALHDGSVTGDDVKDARALRARCLAKLGRRLEAKEAFKGVLRTDRAFRLDPNEVPPDEMDVFKLAAQEIDSEQFEAGKRFPASIAMVGGRGSSVNQDLADLASSSGAGLSPDFSEDPEFGYSVRFPLKPGLSIEFEVQRLRATTDDPLPHDRNAHTEYTSSAMPFVVSMVRGWRSAPKYHVNVFGGLGVMPTQAIAEYKQTLVSGRLTPSQLVGHHTGLYAHAGLEGEWMAKPRLALTARVLPRYAKSGTLDWPSKSYEIYESYEQSKLGDRSADFSGIAGAVGLRAYIGY